MQAAASAAADLIRLRALAQAAGSGEPLHELTMAVVGVRFSNRRRKGQPTGNRQTEAMLCELGEAVELRDERDNPADRNAIAVYSARGVQLGYLSADKTHIVHSAAADGREAIAIFQAITPWGAWIRVAFGGLLPQLPVAPASPSAGAPTRSILPAEAWDGIDEIPTDD